MGQLFSAIHHLEINIKMHAMGTIFFFKTNFLLNVTNKKIFHNMQISYFNYFAQNKKI